MFKFFKKKTPDYIDLDNYDYSAFARDMTEEELLTVNGGKWIGNSDASVAEAEVGDTLKRKDGTVVTITQADIDWAKEQISSPSTTSTTTTTETSSSTSSTPSTSTPQSSVVKRDSTPERESSTVLENIARYKALAGNNQIKPTTVGGKKSSGTAVTGQAVEGKKVEMKVSGSNTESVVEISPHYNSSTFKEKVAGYTAKAVRDAAGKRTRGFPSTTENYPKAQKDGPSQLGDQDPLPLSKANGFDVLTAEYTRSENKMEVTYYNIRNGHGVTGVHSFSFEMTNKVRNELNGLRQDPDIKTIPVNGDPNWYYPREFPNGEWNILKSVPKDGSKDFGTVFIPTNAHQTVPVYGNSPEHPKCENGNLPIATGTQEDTGYGFHYSDYQTTWGCGRGSTQPDITKFAKWSDQALSTFYGGSYVNVHD